MRESYVTCAGVCHLAHYQLSKCIWIGLFCALAIWPRIRMHLRYNDMDDTSCAIRASACSTFRRNIDVHKTSGRCCYRRWRVAPRHLRALAVMDVRSMWMITLLACSRSDMMMAEKCIHTVGSMSDACFFFDSLYFVRALCTHIVRL
jgi:hypothetical protein